MTLNESEVGTLGMKLMQAGLKVGRGKGALLVRRSDVEKVLIDLQKDMETGDLYFSPSAIGSLVKRNTGLKTNIKRNVGIHIHKMYKLGLLERIKVGREYRYRAYPKLRFEAGSTRMKQRHPARAVPEKRKPTTSPPPQKKRDYERSLEHLCTTAEVLSQCAQDLLDDYKDMKKKLGEIL